MKKQKLILLACCCLIWNAFFSQTNLVPNPSFETYTTCPNNASQVNYATSWNNPTTGTPDYFNSCANGTSGVSVPVNYIGNQSPENGVAYAGLFAYDSYGQLPGQSYREYLQAQLTTTLTAGTKYYVTFYASLADSCKYALSVMGVYFSVGQITRTDFDAFTFTPQIANTIGNILSNKMTWYKISGNFIAVGGENYVTIGNFKNDNNTDTVKVSNYSGFNQDFTSAYYYIDNVCISADSLTCNTLIGIQSYNGIDNLNVYSNNNVLYLKGITEDLNVEIYGIEGNLVMKQRADRLENEINLSHFNSGVYIIKINSRNQQQVNKICLIKNPNP